MDASLNQPCRVQEEGLLGCKLLLSGKKKARRGKVPVPDEEAPANAVPAAAVIRRVQALSGFIGCKGCVGGGISQR